MDADTLRHVVRDYKIQTLGSDDAVLVTDESMARHRGALNANTGLAGKITICQIGVFADYVSRFSVSSVDRLISAESLDEHFGPDSSLRPEQWRRRS